MQMVALSKQSYSSPGNNEAMEETDISCPYCGETLGVLIDCSIPEQQYVEECQVCCSPILFRVTIDPDGNIAELTTTQENE
jgi:C4-type Zn-finger protein